MSLAPCSTRPADYQSLVPQETPAQSTFLDSDDDTAMIVMFWRMATFTRTT
jgi:hypothetical protein